MDCDQAQEWKTLNTHLNKPFTHDTELHCIPLCSHFQIDKLREYSTILQIIGIHPQYQTMKATWLYFYYSKETPDNDMSVI